MQLNMSVKQMRSKRAIRILAGVVLPALLAGLTMLLVIYNRPGFTGERIKNPDSYSLDILRMNGTNSHTLSLNAGDVLQVEFETSKGSLLIKITAPDGTIIYAGNGEETTSFFVFGAAQAATGYAAWVFGKQEAFHVALTDYPNIGTNKKRLVVFFSRMGYVRKLAYEEANRSGAQVLEIHTAERTEGTLGFWWCGRYGMHRWAMPIEEISADLAGYDCVAICTPIWVFHLAAPTRAFCKAASGKLKRARYVLVHHQRTSYAEAAEEMDELLCLKAERVTSVCCRRGEYLSQKELRPRIPANQ